MRSEICVVGGGPAGLAAALALTQSGREVTVLDCAVPPIDKPCGEGLMPDCLETLGRLGIQLTGAGMPLQGVRFVSDTASVSAGFHNGLGRGLRRVRLHEHLIARAKAAGIRMFWGVKNVHTRPGRVSFHGGHVDTELIVGADGQKSAVREDAGLNHIVREKRRYAFRRHYGVSPWTPHIEIYWGNHFQIYVTPVASDCVCVALISKDPRLRLETAVGFTPQLARRLKNASVVTSEKGSLSLSRRFKRVCVPGYALVGDASGSVDAITGEGICLAFNQAIALVYALDAGNLHLYERSHREIAAKPSRMAALMLLLDGNETLQRKTLAALQAKPRIFSSLLAAHAGHEPFTSIISWQLLSFGLGVLCG